MTLLTLYYLRCKKNGIIAQFKLFKLARVYTKQTIDETNTKKNRFIRTGEESSEGLPIREINVGKILPNLYATIYR